jgi:hypothetical protein
VLILNILNSKAAHNTKSETQIQLLTAATNKESGQIYQHMPKQINNFLIYPTPTSFKYMILPFLSSAHILKLYNHFKKSYPELDLSKWLEYFDSNIVLDYLNESKILYRGFSILKPILYSTKTKIAKIVENFDLNTPAQCHCAFLPSGKVVHFLSQNLLGSSQTFMFAENFNEKEFFVTDESFAPIAYGKVSEMILFENHKTYICVAQNLNCLQKCLLKLRYYSTIFFLKYLKRMSPCLECLSIFTHQVKYSNCQPPYVKDGCCCPCNLAAMLLIFVISKIATQGFILPCIAYHIVMIPFHILSLLATFFLFKFSFLSFCGFTVTFFFGYSYFFPKIIDDFLIHLYSNWGISNKKYLTNFSFTIFEIKPKNKMMFFPFLIPRKRNYLFYVFVLIFEILFSLMFKPFITNWV